MKKNYLKKIALLTLSTVMATTILAGCGSSDSSSSSSSTPAAGSSSSSTSTPAVAAKAPAEYKGEIKVWSWNDELKTAGIIEKFNKTYPGITVTLVTIPNDGGAYVTKVSSTMSAGVGVPDVFLGESAFIKKFANADYYEDLSKAPYSAEALTGKMVPYTVELGKNAKDNSIRALTWQATPGGFFYKRSLAKQYLGTDAPEEVQKMMSTPADFIKMGETLKTKSSGAVKLLAGYGEFANVALSSRSLGWVDKDNKLVIDPKMTAYLDDAKAIRDGGLDAKFDQWTPAWTGSMSDKTTFGYMLPTWGLPYVIASNAPKMEGDYAFVQAPTPYMWGGTWLGIAAKSTQKDNAWQFVKYITSDTAYMTAQAKDKGDFMNNTETQAALAGSADGNNKYLAGQNIYKAYAELVKNVNGKTFTEYDDTINTTWNDTTKLFISGKLATKEDMIAAFKKAVKTAYPDIKVD